MKIKALIIIPVIFYSSILYPCTCRWAGPFFLVSLRTQVVVKGKVEKYIQKENYKNAPAMIVKVYKVLKGKEFVTGKRIIIIGDDGASCRPYVEDSFKKDKFYIFALFRDKKKFKKYNYNEFYISKCGEFWLKIKSNKYIEGVIYQPHYKHKQKMKLDKFLKLSKCFFEKC